MPSREQHDTVCARPAPRSSQPVHATTRVVVVKSLRVEGAILVKGVALLRNTAFPSAPRPESSRKGTQMTGLCSERASS